MDNTFNNAFGAWLVEVENDPQKALELARAILHAFQIAHSCDADGVVYLLPGGSNGQVFGKMYYKGETNHVYK